MSSFNVVQIIPSLESGGAERGALDVSSYLSELKFKNSIISNGGRLINEINKNYTTHFQLAVHSKNFFSYPTIANKLKKISLVLFVLSAEVMVNLVENLKILQSLIGKKI